MAPPPHAISRTYRPALKSSSGEARLNFRLTSGFVKMSMQPGVQGGNRDAPGRSVANRRQSVYRPGMRSRDWVMIPIRQRDAGALSPAANRKGRFVLNRPVAEIARVRPSDRPSILTRAILAGSLGHPQEYPRDPSSIAEDRSRTLDPLDPPLVSPRPNPVETQDAIPMAPHL